MPSRFNIFLVDVCLWFQPLIYNGKFAVEYNNASIFFPSGIIHSYWRQSIISDRRYRLGELSIRLCIFDIMFRGLFISFTSPDTSYVNDRMTILLCQRNYLSKACVFSMIINKIMMEVKPLLSHRATVISFSLTVFLNDAKATIFQCDIFVSCKISSLFYLAYDILIIKIMKNIMLDYSILGISSLLYIFISFHYLSRKYISLCNM